ncbi:sensor histidine kinase [Hyalangium rubrum]|uniref:histidine kinase n=1 Tax=Hyalangium rubrum TaxID=3103134 RepID=A0ABU5GZZ5_9BACT|nr:ATP-binding protein [Hyalangium sp. s54d21]MDY7226447.1 ATP-binding protein [Hyalangium sp. s54d21]
MRLLARRLLLLLATAAPFLACWLFIDAYLLPARLVPQVLNLGGTWKVQEGDAPGWEAPELDDTRWREFQLPGGYSAQGFRADRAWARKRFELPPALQGQPLLFTLGGVRTGRATVFLNGHAVGQTDEFARGPKADIEGLDAWKVDPRDLRPGENVLALRFEWALIGDDGVVDARVLLGTFEQLTPYYLRGSDLRRFVQSGALVLFLFMLVLLGTFLRQEADPARRALQRATFFLIGAAAFYLCVLTGSFAFLSQASAFTYTCLISSVTIMAWALLEFCEQYCLERPSRLRKVHRVICVGVLLTLASSYAFAQAAWSPTVYQLFAPYLFFLLPYVVVLTTRALMRRKRAADLVVTATLFCIFGAGIIDLLTDLYVVHAPRLFGLAVVNMGLCAGAILIADFIQLSYVNKRLSASLAGTNVELGEALRRAEDVARIKGELLANVSHELRTPLNAIINLPQGLLSSFVEQPAVRCHACAAGFELEAGESVGPDTACPSCGAQSTLEATPLCRFDGDLAEVPRHLRTISRSGTHLMRLINDVLDFSHLESGKGRLRLEPLSVSQLWSELHETMGPLARVHDLELRFAPVDSELGLRADPIKLTQILVNLLGNAIKFSPPGGTVELTVAEEPGNLVFCVRDQGIGIAPEHHQLIFESFRQVDGSHTRKFGGSGLGLSITRKLVELHQGNLWLESALGQGSAFFVRLPREGPVEAAPGAPSPSDRHPRTGS